MWATGYDHEQACVTQSQPFELGCYGEESDHFINFKSVPALPTQWWYPEDSGAGWDRAYSEGQYLPSPPSESTDRGLSTDGDLMASASSSSTAPGSSTHIWHGPTPPACDMTYTGMDSTAYMPVDEPTGLE